MSAHSVEASPSAYAYPLLVKQLVTSALNARPEQEIVYVDKRRYTYAEFARRLHRPGSGLSGPGVSRGDTAAVMDWNSHRYLECSFAIPMRQPRIRGVPRTPF